MEYFVAKTFAGLETELLKELHALGAKNCAGLENPWREEPGGL